MRLKSDAMRLYLGAMFIITGTDSLLGEPRNISEIRHEIPMEDFKTEDPGEVVCTKDNSFHIVLLGETGVGKSTYGNYILGLNSKEGFQVGGGADSVTLETQTLHGRFLGKAENPCISVTDTPGLGDTKCRDEQHMKGIIHTIMDYKKVDQFVLVFRGTDNRFESGIQRMIQTFTTLLGKELFSSLLIEFTFFRHDARSRLLREMSNMTHTVLSKTWNNQFKERFNLTNDIPTVFIDPLYLEEIADAEEIEFQEGELEKFKGFLVNKTRFECLEDCFQQLSLWYDMMKPRILTNSIREKRGHQVELTCSIWLESECPLNSTSSKRSLVWTLHANSTEIPVLESNSSVYQVEELLGEELPIETSKLRFEIQDDTEGEYSCQYGYNWSHNISVSMILGPKVDGVWTDWSLWSQCSWINGSRISQRHRHCIPPQNRGLPCLGEYMQSKYCTSEDQEIEKCFNSGYSWNNDLLLDIIRDTDKWKCQKACLDNKSCKGHTWYDSNSKDQSFANSCKLFSDVGETVESDGFSGKRNCSCSLPVTCKISNNKDYQPLFNIMVPSERACKELCGSTDYCNFYTWYDSNSFAKYQCFLYSNCEEGESCQSCHSGPRTCGSICPSVYLLSHSSRNVQSFTRQRDFCDHTGRYPTRIEWHGDAWYEFSGDAGARIADEAIDGYKCGTTSPGWFNGTHPLTPGTIRKGTVCFGRDCNSNVSITVRHCGYGYQYFLPNVPDCNAAYCAV